MATPFVGEIRMFGGNFAPVGWAICDGQILSISEYEVLFVLIGTTYGGDGQSTFALPDLRSRVPLHQGTGPGLSPRMLGEFGGEERVLLTLSQTPAHRHSFRAGDSPANTAASPRDVLGQSTAPIYGRNTPSTAMAADAVTLVGGSQPHNNLPPYLTVNFIIAYQGIFPSPT